MYRTHEKSKTKDLGHYYNIYCSSLLNGHTVLDILIKINFILYHP